MKKSLSFPLLCLLLAGCATLAPERIAVPSGAVRLTPQWRAATGSNARTVEVFVENGTEAPLALSNLALDGMTLPALPPMQRKKGAPPMPLWWRIAPPGDVPPGCHAVIAVCFTNAPAPFELAVDANGERQTIAVSAPDSPWKRIADVAFAPRGRSVFVKVESRGVPVKSLLLDGVETPFRTLRDGRTGHPFVLAAETRAALRPGARLLVDARFADGGRALASARVLRGPVLEAQSADKAARKALGADAAPAIRPAPFADVGCYDLETKTTGGSASAMLRHLSKKPRPAEEISAVQFCMGCVAETWDIYGALADAAISMPFPALRFGTPAKRLELEEKAFLHAADAAAPRPIVWTAQLFRHGDTAPPPDETLTAFWMTLALGSRGMTAYLWKSRSGYIGMDALPEMRDAWTAMAKPLRKHRDRLFPLLAADRFEAADGALKVYTAWNPGKGMLVVWRAADAAPLAADLDFDVRNPEWLKPRDVRDLIREGREKPRVSRGSIRLRATSGATHGAFWIEATR